MSASELNLLEALSENRKEAARKLSDVLKNTFLKPHGCYFVFSSHLVSTTYELSAYMDSFSQRNLAVHKLPLIPSLKVAEVLLHFPKLNAQQALFYGLIPALIYEAGRGETVSPNAIVAMQPWINAGIDTEEVLALLTSFIDGKSTNVPRCLSQLMDTFHDARERLVRWIPYHMVAVLDDLQRQKHVDGDLRRHLGSIVNLDSRDRGSVRG